jgi:hypothetical protein
MVFLGVEIVPGSAEVSKSRQTTSLSERDARDFGVGEEHRRIDLLVVALRWAASEARVLGAAGRGPALRAGV